ncbi:MAG: metal-dependent hydrolase [Geovibrio sp.]|nr:metal-dependent hydrolase [Geovibrio sp.]MCD8569402.1 metal-dependent hydrolase [Geovibrio sp.]
MKFTSHKAINGSVAVFLGFDLMGIVTMTLGSVLPDIIDKALSGNSEIVWDRVHRTLSHWWIIWALILYFSHRNSDIFVLSMPVFKIVSHLAFGSLLHILCDSMTLGGVPLFNPFRQSFGLRLFHTGSPQEYVFVTIIASTLLYFGVGK